MALSRVTGADAEQRLKTVTQRNQQFATSVRKAIGVAETLSKAQAAARSLPALASGMTAQLGSVAAVPPETGTATSLRWWDCSRWPRPRWPRSSPYRATRRARAAPPSCACARTSAIRRPSCACSTSSRASPTAISRCRPRSPRTSPAPSPTPSTTPSRRCASWSPPSTTARSSWTVPPGKRSRPPRTWRRRAAPSRGKSRPRASPWRTWPPPSKKSRATRSAARTSRATRSTSPTKAAMPCVAPSTA